MQLRSVIALVLVVSMIGSQSPIAWAEAPASTATDPGADPTDSILRALVAEGTTGADSAEPVLQLLAQLELLSADAARIPLREPVEKVAPALEARFRRMQALVTGARDAHMVRPGTAIVARSMSQLGYADQAATWASAMIGRRFGGCGSFSECNSAVRDLADLIDIAPRAVLNAITTRLKPVAADLTWRMTRDSATPFRDSLAQQILLYRLESLALLARFHLDTRYVQAVDRGLTPMSEVPKLTALRSGLRTLDESFTHLVPPRRESWDLDETWRLRLGEYHTRLGEDLARDLLEFESGANAIDLETVRLVAEDMAQGLVRTQLGNQSLDLYLERFNRRDLAPWLHAIGDRIEQGRLSRETVQAMALRFLRAEAQLPFRRDWLALLASTGPEADLLLVAETMVAQQEAQARDFLQQQGLGKRGQALLSQEKALATRHPVFHSVVYQSGRLTAAQNALGQAALSAPKDRKRLARVHDQAVSRWLALACYGAWATDDVTRSPEKIFFSDGDKYRLNQACPTAHARGPDASVEHHVRYRRKVKTWKPIAVEVGITAAMIPLTMVSGGVATFATRPVAGLAARAVGGAAARLSLRRATTAAMMAVIPRVTTAVAGAVVFTAMQRTLMSAFTLGRSPLYDPKKSLMGNYGKELIWGSAVFFFLPFSSAMTERWVNRLGWNQNRGRALALRVGVDTTIFAAIPYFEQEVEKAGRNLGILRATGEAHPELGWRDLPKQVLHAAAFALAFRLHGPAAHTPQAGSHVPAKAGP